MILDLLTAPHNLTGIHEALKKNAFGTDTERSSTDASATKCCNKKTTVSDIEDESDTMEIVDENSQNKGKLEDINIDGRLDFFV